MILVLVAPSLDYDAKFKTPQVAKAGGNVTIPVNVAGTPTPKVEWTLNGKAVTQTSTTVIESLDKTSTLSLKSLSPQNAGTVKITATNAAGTASAEFKITLKGI